MTVRTFFNGRNIVLALLVALLFLVYSSLQTADSTLSKILTPKPTLVPTVAESVQDQTVQQEADQKVEGAKVERQIAHVVKVIDGDTITVSINGTTDTIRIIGLNTPETVDPRKGVECFGREASAFAKQTLSGKTVYLEPDASQSERDKYGRLLRFVFLEDNSDYGKVAIQEGFGYEYTYDLPYRYQTEYKQAQQQAQTYKRGLWEDNICKN